MLKVCAISDLHGYLPELEPCDIVFICGDFSPLEIQANGRKMRKWLLEEFKPWAENIQCDKVIFIAGNHDYIAYRDPDFMRENFRMDMKVVYLCDQQYTYVDKDDNIYRIYGTPWCRQFFNWPFMESDEELNKLYLHIPDNLDFLLTHDQPYGYGDIILQDIHWNTGEHIGNKILLEHVFVRQPKYMFCGHLHATDHNCVEIKETKRYNVSLKDEYYEPIYEPLYLEI